MKTWCGTVSDGGGRRQGAVVLLSGGLDSTVSLAMAGEEYFLDTALFFDYGQLSIKRELDASRKIAGHYGVRFLSIDLPWLGELSRSALIAGSGEIPDFPTNAASSGEAEVAGEVWVENRNGIFLNIAAAVAASAGCEVLIAGFNREEAATFPDNSGPFIEAVNEAMRIGAGSPVRVESPTLHMTKEEIVRHGLDMEIPWEYLWSCYRGGRKMCGRCESCVRLSRAVAGTGALSLLRFEKEAR